MHDEERQPPVKVGDVVELTPEKPAMKPEHCVARINGYVVFVATASSNVGKRLKCKITTVFPRYAFAEVVA